MFNWLQRWFSGSAAAPAPMAMPAADPVVPPAASPYSVAYEQKDRINHQYAAWLFSQAPGASQVLRPAEKQVLASLDVLLQERRAAAEQVKRRPRVIPEILQLLRHDNFSGSAIAAKISDDPVLVAAVLELANEALKNSGQHLANVEHAVIAIGQQGLRELIMKVAFRPIVDLQSGRYTRQLAPRIWNQSERCAAGNGLLAAHSGVAPFDAFLAGLVQNVGLLTALSTLDQAPPHSEPLGSAMFYVKLLQVSRQLSYAIGEEWGFPPPVMQAIQEQAGPTGNERSALGQLLAMTDYLSKLKILDELGRLETHQDGARLFVGLPAYATEVYALLYTPQRGAAGSTAAVDAPAPAPLASR